jgi:hypothetical protein
MAHPKSIEVRRVLSSVISPSQLEQTAREEGFIQRARKVDPVINRETRRDKPARCSECEFRTVKE